MQHPLENPSLTPYGFAFPRSQKRLEYVPTITILTFINPERVITKLWAKWNRSHAQKPLPVRMIIHYILPSLASANRLSTGDFWHDRLPYLGRDILVLSSLVQWLATNVGGCFLETDISRRGIPGYHPEREFLIKQEIERKLGGALRDIPAFITHICTERCEKVRTLFQGSCYYNPQDVSARDRAVVDGLLRWLASKSGRVFIAHYQARHKRAQDVAYEKAHAQRGVVRA